MEKQPSSKDHTGGKIVQKGQTSERRSIFAISFSDDEEDEIAVCINSVLPDDLLEKILGHLPLATIMKACCVCKKWNDVVKCGTFTQSPSILASQKPWYFMFTCDDGPEGRVYDPMLSKWHRFQTPHIDNPNWDMASSSGLVCLMESVRRKNLYVCNPIRRICRRLLGPPSALVPDYSALAISADRSSLSYKVTIVKSKQIPESPLNWIFTIHIYSSENEMWVSPLEATVQGRRGGVDSVIIGGVLYFAIYRTMAKDYAHFHCGVLPYDLTGQPSDLSVTDQVIVAPSPLTCMRLVNIDEQLVMVGGIEKLARPSILTAIGVWVLKGKEWKEVSRMPNRCYKGFGEFDDVFACSGSQKLIYIHSYGSPSLLMFDMESKDWFWANKGPVVKKFTIQLFSGVCFEPRLDLVP